MNINSNKYVFTFAVIVCVVCSILLSGLAEGLRQRQETNADLEVKKNILKAVGLKEPIRPDMQPNEIFDVYASKIEEVVIDAQGNMVEGKKPQDIKEGDKGMLPLYLYKEGDDVIAYAYPVVGQGLWSALYGYLALEADGTTVRGMTFYKHGETPGLGAEIEKDWFQDNFKGKKVFSTKDNKLTPIIVAKGKASEQYRGDELEYHVDGITAATLTCQGVTDLFGRWINIYEPYFKKVRSS